MSIYFLPIPLYNDINNMLTKTEIPIIENIIVGDFKTIITDL